MIYCTIVQCSLLCTTYDKSFYVSSSNNALGRQSVQILTDFYSHYGDTGGCQRLFWPEAVCFQDINRISGGILLIIYLLLQLIFEICQIIVTLHSTESTGLTNDFKDTVSTTLNAVVMNVIIYTCAFPNMTCQSVCCENDLRDPCCSVMV